MQLLEGKKKCLEMSSRFYEPRNAEDEAEIVDYGKQLYQENIWIGITDVKEEQRYVKYKLGVQINLWNSPLVE